MKLVGLNTILSATVLVLTRTAASESGTSLPASGGTSNSLRHNLQAVVNEESQPPCNTVIASISVEEVQFFAEILLQSALGLAGLEDFQDTLGEQLIAPFVKYGLTVHKVCGSCDDVRKHWGDDDSVSPTAFNSFDGYCGANVHGSDATHSALVFVPNTSNSTEMDPISGNLPSFGHMHSFVTDLADCPTEKWPSSISDALQATVANNAFADFLVNFQDFFAGVLIASSGAVSIFPDYIGYGESTNLSRSNMGEAYAQAAVVSYAATGLYLNEETNGCSRLANVGSMLGLSEGGFGVVTAATALQDFIDLRHVASGAGPLNTFAQMVSVVDAYDTGSVSLALNNVVYQVVVPFIGFIHSNDLPGLANSGSEQRFLSPEFQDPADISTDAFQWFLDPTALNFFEILAFSPANALDTLNPNLVNVLRESGARGETETCPLDLIEAGVNDLICPTLAQGNLWPTILKTNLPLEICFSPDDTVTSPTNFPPTLFDNNPNVRAFDPPIPQLSSSGDHLQAQVLCSNSALLAFLADPLPVEPLTSEQEKVCLADFNDDGDKKVTDEDFFLPVVVGGALVVFILVAVVTYCCCCRRNK